jgi:DNA-binding transcriptional regulator YbjK
MVQATFIVPIAEFDAALVDKIKQILNSDGDNAEILIQVRPKKSRTKKVPMLRQETRQQYFERLEKSVQENRQGQSAVQFEDIDALEATFK